MTSSFDDPRHRKSEELAFRAERQWALGRRDESRAFFSQAAALEEEAARALDQHKPNARGALAVSAVALWYKANDLGSAKRAAYWFLARSLELTTDAIAQLEELVDRCMRETELSRFADDPNAIPVELRLMGGRVGVGIAPISATRRKRDSAEILLTRTAELVAGHPYRVAGESELARTQEIQLFEIPARAASFGVRFFVTSGDQIAMPHAVSVTPEGVVRRFLALAAAAKDGPDALRAAVNNEEYEALFLEHFGEIAPDGQDVESVTCHSPTWRVAGAPTSTFEPENRQVLKAAATGRTHLLKEGERRISGRILAFHSSVGSQYVEFKPDKADDSLHILFEQNRLRTLLLSRVGQQANIIVQFTPRARRDLIVGIDDQ